TTVRRPVKTPEDLAGVKIRVPPGQMVFDTFQAFGAQPVTTPANGIYAALENGKVDAQENPLAVAEGFRLYRLIKYVSMTNPMWSGFNLMAHLPTWRDLPDDIRAVVERNAETFVRRQRLEQERRNVALRATFEQRGILFNDVDQVSFRARLPAFYAAWKEKL